MNLVKILFNAAKSTSSKVSEILEAAMEKATKDVIENLIGSYSSEFKRNLTEKMQEAMNVGLDGIELQDYSSFIINKIEKDHKKVIDGVDLSGIERTIKDIVEPLKSTYKLSDIVEAFKEQYDDYEVEDIDCCYFDCEYIHENEWHEINIAKSEEDKKDGGVRLLVGDNGSLFSASANINCKYINTHMVDLGEGGFNSFILLLLRLKSARKTKIELDIDYVDTEYSQNEDY